MVTTNHDKHDQNICKYGFLERSGGKFCIGHFNQTSVHGHPIIVVLSLSFYRCFIVTVVTLNIRKTTKYVDLS